MIYYLSDVTLFIYFSTNPKCVHKLQYTSWDVPSDTVTSINVALKHPPLVAKTDIDLTKLKKVKGDYDLIDRYHYLSSEDGFSIEVGNDYVMGYYYWPGTTHDKLRCARSAQP